MESSIFLLFVIWMNKTLCKDVACWNVHIMKEMDKELLHDTEKAANDESKTLSNG